MMMMMSQKFLVAMVSCFLVQVSLAAVSSEIQQLLQLANAERAAKGAQPLCLNDKLNQVAQRYAQEIDASGSMSHEGADGTNLPMRLKMAGFRFTSAGENLAMGSQPQHAIYGWVKSPSHYSSMTDPRQSLAGIGHSGERWVMLYAASRDEKCSSEQSAPAAADTPAPSNPDPPPPPPPAMSSPTPSSESAPTQMEAVIDLSSFANPDALKSIITSLIPGLSDAPEKLDEIIQALERHGIGKGGVTYMAG
ncbi:hypothetical protein MIR68_000558 [Amoeboaphelidium protococcarum]|nr:hypothetical protein MIR68_000558 [Amoeboaphelidium protococcarum]